MRDRGFESIGVADQPINRVASITCACNSRTLRIDVWELRDGIENSGHVRHYFPAPVLRNLIDELLAKTSRTTGVWRSHDPSLRRPQGGVPSIRPAVLPGALRAAVNKKDSGISARSIEVWRFEQPILNRRAGSPDHRQRIVLRRTGLIKPCGILIGKLLRTTALNGNAIEISGSRHAGFSKQNEIG